MRPIADVQDEPKQAQDPQRLLEQFAQGQPAAFDRIVAIHQERITRLAYRLLGWQAEAEDIVQEVFLAAWKQRKHFRAQSSLETWLTTITINRCRTHRRRRWLHWRWLGRQIGVRPRATESADAPAARDEISEQVRRAVQDLSPADREVIVLYYLEQMSVAQMASLLNASPNAIDVRLHRARQRLKEKLSRFMQE
jgi:RNA polymerase sigma-70 factor (ECF subfamily)